MNADAEQSRITAYKTNMNAITFIVRYAFYIPLIAYLLTTNWEFYRPMLYLRAEGFVPLYLFSLIGVAMYICIIEAFYCLQVFAHIKKHGGIARSKRKLRFFLSSLATTATINLIFLHYDFSTKQQTLHSAGYLKSGLFFFLLVMLSYMALVWYKPRNTIGFWVMERFVVKVVEGIEQKHDTNPAPTSENEAYRLTEQADSTYGLTLVVMDILLLTSGRGGVYLYLRSGRCIYRDIKLKALFNDEQLSWFAEYQKGSRVNLMHLKSLGKFDNHLHFSPSLYTSFVEGLEKSPYESRMLLELSPAYHEKLTQELRNKKMLDKTVLSQSIYLKR